MLAVAIESNIPVKVLNMLSGSPRFICAEVQPDGRGFVESPPSVLPGRGQVWLSGETTLKSGETVASVFAIDTDTGGTLLSVWWHISGRWYDAIDGTALPALGRSKSEITPWDWRYNLPVVEDIYHT